MFMPNSIYTRTAYWKGGVIVQVCVGADLLVGRLQVAPQDGCTENEINDLTIAATHKPGFGHGDLFTSKFGVGVVDLVKFELDCIHAHM